MSDLKTPGEIAHAAYWAPEESMFDWSNEGKGAQKSWEAAATAVRAPLLQRIEELEAALDSRTHCHCGTALDLHCSDIGCDHNKTDYGGFQLDRIQPWLDAPDKPGWWLTLSRDETKRCRYDARRVSHADLVDPEERYVFTKYLWRIFVADSRSVTGAEILAVWVFEQERK